MSNLKTDGTTCKPGYTKIAKQCFIYRGVHKLSLSESICEKHDDKLPSREDVKNVLSQFIESLLKKGYKPVIIPVNEREKYMQDIYTRVTYFAESKFWMSSDGATPASVICEQKSTIVSGSF